MYSAENRLVKALPNLAEGAKSPTLKSLFTVHLDATKGRVERLKQIFVLRDKKPTGEHCNGGSGFKEVLAAAQPILQAAEKEPEEEEKPKSGREKYSVQKSREDKKKAAPDLRKRRA